MIMDLTQTFCQLVRYVTIKTMTCNNRKTNHYLVTAATR